MSTEIKLIIECCKTTKNTQQLTEYINKIEDWDSFIPLAYGHGIFPLVYKSLKEFQQLIPNDIFIRMKQHYMDIVKQNMLMTSELIKVLKILEENNIEAISFKGPVLSQLAYGDVVSRQYCDLDILVKEEDLKQIYNLLIKSGYKSETNKIYLENSKFLDISKDLIFFNKDNGITIEIHWRLFEKRFFFNRLSFDELSWINKKKIKINNSQILTFKNEYLIYYLIIHGSKHFWERIEWLSNIYLIINKNKDINFYKIFEYSKIMKTQNMLKVFFLLLEKHFGFVLEEEIFINNNSLKIVEQIERNWIIIEQKKGLNIKEIRFIILLQDSFINKLKIFYKTIFQIKISDITSTNFPIKFTFMYYIIRFTRFFKKYFS